MPWQAVLLGAGIFAGVRQIVSFLPTVFQEFVSPFLEEGFVWIEELFRMAEPETLEVLEGGYDSMIEALGGGIVSLSNGILSAVAGLAARVPGIFMKIVITIIATVFLAMFLAAVYNKICSIQNDNQSFYWRCFLWRINQYM